MASNAATSAASAIVSTGNQSRMARTASWAGVRVGTTSGLPRPGGPAPAAACCANAEGRSRPGVLLVTHLIVLHGGSGARASAHRNARAHLSLSASSTLASVRASPQSPAPRSSLEILPLDRATDMLGYLHASLLSVNAWVALRWLLQEPFPSSRIGVTDPPLHAHQRPAVRPRPHFGTLGERRARGDAAEGREIQTSPHPRLRVVHPGCCCATP
jgi:hypothetical protein